MAGSIAASNILGSLIFLSLAKPTKWNAWPAFGTFVRPLDPESYLSTPGEVPSVPCPYLEPRLLRTKVCKL